MSFSIYTQWQKFKTNETSKTLSSTARFREKQQTIITDKIPVPVKYASECIKKINSGVVFVRNFIIINRAANLLL